jgi:hypothetical protein
MTVQEKINAGCYYTRMPPYVSKEENLYSLKIYHAEVRRLQDEFVSDVIQEHGLFNHPAKKLIIKKAFEYGDGDGLQGVYYWVLELLQFLNDYERLKDE